MRNSNVFNDEYFEIYKIDNQEITVQSRNTGHFWNISKFMGKYEVSHKHHINQTYHREKWRIRNLIEAKEKIIKHDIYQLNGRKPIDNEFLDYLVKMYK